MTILVIADDLTGAAEIAGIGRRYGYDTALLRRDYQPIFAQMLVIDSDTRRLNPQAAGDTIRRMLAECPVNSFDWIYKKTDSVLRGPVRAELEAAQAALGLQRVLLVPQNPSRGRVVSRGTYSVGGVPLHRSEFGRDPDHPAKTSDIRERLSPDDPQRVTHLAVGQPPPSSGLITADAGTDRHLVQLATWVNDRTLPAGGSEFFETLLMRTKQGMPRGERRWPFASCLMLCGSTAEADRHAAERAGALGLPVRSMPLPLPRTDSQRERWIEAWRHEILESLSSGGGVVVTTPARYLTDAMQSGELAPLLARVVSEVLGRHALDEVLVSGGTTAGALMDALGGQAFRVSGEWAPGVVRLAFEQERKFGITLKPGSYHWPASLWELLGRAIHLKANA
ncbi:MAG: hypothetical protein IT445_13830 [Phycisphaeraceae bacterium]|nr:hypothetical protein [Phycisphaeraceae bacterium]